MRWMAGLLTTVLALTLSACMMDGVGPKAGTGEGQLLILNALGQTDSVRLYLDGAAVATPPSGSATASAITPGSHTLDVRTSVGAILGTRQFVVSAGGRRTALVAGSLVGGDAFSFQLAVDTASLPPAHHAKVRFIQAAPGTVPLRLFFYEELAPPGAGDPPLVQQFSFGSGSGTYFPDYFTRPAGYYILKAYDLEGNLVAQTAMTLGKSMMWSMVLVRNPSGTQEFRAVREGNNVAPEPGTD